MDITVTNPEVVDVRFPLNGRLIPYDYADALWTELRPLLPWLESDPWAGVHPIDGLSPAEGAWHVSRRSRLTLRISPDQADSSRTALEGRTLDLDGYRIGLGTATVRELAPSSVLYARFVAMTPPSPAEQLIAEDVFLDTCRAQFDQLGMRPKLVCGLAQRARTAAGLLSGFSLMLSELEPEDIRRLQREGLGVERKRGCGIFVPHKSGASLVTLE
ncbi:MAG: type I-MYXAN CRISPR-associated protein Cas6/Cmx6 [Pseudomonadota bacterium]